MNGLMGLVVLASSLWMAVDASQLGYEKQDIRGLAGMGPVGWFFAGLLLWIVAFPLYLIKRPELKAAGERRRQWALTGGMPPGLPGGGYGPPPYGGAPGWGPPRGPGGQTYGGPQAYGGPQGYAPPHGGPGPYGSPGPGYGGAPPAPGYGGAPPAPGYGAPMSQGYTPPAPAASAGTPAGDPAEAITKLAELRSRGLLSDDEFERKKAELLARM